MDPLPLRSGETSRLTEPPAHFADGQSKAQRHHRRHLPPALPTWTEVAFLSTPTPGLEESGVAAWVWGLQQLQVGGWVGGVYWSLLPHVTSLRCHSHRGRNLCFHLMSCTPWAQGACGLAWEQNFDNDKGFSSSHRQP